MNPKPPATMATTPWQDELTERLTAKFGGQILEAVSYLGQNFLVVEPAAVVPLLEHLRDMEQFHYLVDLTAVDYPAKEERFELIYILYSFERNERLRVKARVKEGEKPHSVVRVFATANWLEREAFDMFGIEFAHHPDLRRILMPDEWRGYPLRKDYKITQMDNNWVQENLEIPSGQ
jgi:NADH-quinone oxidoreductase subunit C